VPFTGWVKIWNDDGGLVELTHFKKGQEDGLGLLWHDNGFLKEQGYFTDGYEEGEWVFWNRDGNETKRETYDKGIRVEE
jgi:antitoxin component YwqK of YwqJK toxin-antitoxin module